MLNHHFNITFLFLQIMILILFRVQPTVGTSRVDRKTKKCRPRCSKTRKKQGLTNYLSTIIFPKTVRTLFEIENLFVNFWFICLFFSELTYHANNNNRWRPNKNIKPGGYGQIKTILHVIRLLSDLERRYSYVLYFISTSLRDLFNNKFLSAYSVGRLIYIQSHLSSHFF